MNFRLYIFLILIFFNLSILVFKLIKKKDNKFSNELIFSVVMLTFALVSLFLKQPREILTIVSILFLIDIPKLIAKFRNNNLK
ncbi:MAG: hypothetical protein ACRC7N_00130 [Clostridium sp.]